MLKIGVNTMTNLSPDDMLRLVKEGLAIMQQQHQTEMDEKLRRETANNERLMALSPHK
jgi:hypothetical protein